MAHSDSEANREFKEVVAGLKGGDFSWLAPQFEAGPPPENVPCPIVRWFERGDFAREPEALAEALTCACFLGHTSVAEYLLDRGVDPLAGVGTGLNAFHWAANRGQLETVRMLIARRVPLETRNSYGGTVLGSAVWAAVHETKSDHLAVIESLLRAGAQVDAAEFPSGRADVDELLRRHGAGSAGGGET